MRTFRPGATLGPLFLWTVIVAVAAYFIEKHALKLPRGTEQRWMWQLLFAACIVLGPLSFAAHLLRRLLISVRVDPHAGLVLNERTTVPWREIESIEHRAPPFRPWKLGAAGEAMSGFEGCAWVGVAAPEGCLVAFVVLLILGIAYAVFLPVLSLFSPWHPRVVIRLKDGQRIVFRDIAHDDEFVDLVRPRVAAGPSAA